MNFQKIFLSVFFLSVYSSNAQDTLHINLQTADSLFLKNNFYLLASSMNIEAQKAQIIQAKVYPNPVFTADLNAYDPQNNKIFHIGQTGEKSFQFEQLILLGGNSNSVCTAICFQSDRCKVCCNAIISN
jgi:cobalt-zinc-cadmium efflux system outer membrane protein